MNMSESNLLLALPGNSTGRNDSSASPTSNRKNQLTSSSRRKQKFPKKRKKDHAFQNILKYQKSVDFLIPRSSFCRLLGQILKNIVKLDIRLTVLSIQALQEACETYMTQYFQDAYACTLYRKSSMLSVQDMRLVRFLRGPNDPANH